MSKLSPFKHKNFHLHPYSAGILTIGFFFLALYASLLYIFVDCSLPRDPGHAYVILLPTLEDFLVALISLLFGTALLNRLYLYEK